MGNSAHWNRQGGQAKCRATSKKSLFVVDRAVPACRWVKETSLNDFFFFPLPALLFSDSLSHFPIHEGSLPKSESIWFPFDGRSLAGRPGGFCLFFFSF